VTGDGAEDDRVDSWDEAEAFFSGVAADRDFAGMKAQTNLHLLRTVRERWSTQLECFRVMGVDMVFSPRSAPYSLWVRVEPRPDTKPDPTVAIALYDGGTRPSGAGWPKRANVVGGDVCRVPTASAVLESFLLQIGDEDEANGQRLDR
jgi:hypothetical protein